MKKLGREVMERMVKINEVPYQYSNEAKDGKYVLTLSGNIRERYWSEDKCIDAKLIKDSLDEITDDIVIKLNSPGGDVFQGIEMYNYLKDHPSHITVEVTGVAASAATFLVAGANKVIMNVGTTLMIHEASTFAWGNKSDIKKAYDSLLTIDESILNIYIEKTEQSAEQLTEWINQEKWFTADEAVKYGFADEVKKEKKTTNDLDVDIEALVAKEVSNAMANMQITNSSIPKPQELPQQKSLINKLRRGEKK